MAVSEYQRPLSIDDPSLHKRVDVVTLENASSFRCLYSGQVIIHTFCSISIDLFLSLRALMVIVHGEKTLAKPVMVIRKTCRRLQNQYR